MVSLDPAIAQQIVPDGRTATSLSTQGNVTNVFTATQRGANAFNSFIRFDVNAGNVANLHVPSSASNLINLVSGSATNIHGVLNAIKDGRIGGNIWFANPHGFVVGATGIVNVGTLTVSAPTPQFVSGFFLSPGNPDDASVAQLLSGTAPRSGTGLISIQGQVNAVDGVNLSAGAINVGGSIYSGARFIGSAPGFTDVVNANGLASATNVVVKEGRIQIVADDDVTVSGTIAAPGGPGVRGGDVAIRAGGNVELNPGANIVARGLGENSAGGTVYLWGDRDAAFRSGALIDASAGSSGDGGRIELSAKNRVELAGGEFRAVAPGGKAGSVLIDPATVTVSANFYSGGTNHTITADDSITVNAGVVVSTRNVTGGAGANQETAPSAGNSGDLTLQAPSIVLANGSKLLAQADGAHTGGSVTLEAKSQPAVSILGYREASASIQIGDATGGATIRGSNVSIGAATDVSTKWTYQTNTGGTWIDDPTDVNTLGRTLALGASTAAEAAVGFLATLVGVNIVHSQAVGTSSIVVKGGSTIEGQNVTLRAENTTVAGAAPSTGLNGPGTQVNTPLGLGALYARNKADASVTVENNATIKGQNLTVRAHNDATLEASVSAADAGSDSGDISIAVGVTNANIQSRASIAQGANLKVTGNVSVAATNRNSLGNTVEAQTGDNGKASAAVAVSEFTTKATAELNASVKDAAKVEVLAINENTQNVTTANSKTGSTLNDMIIAGFQQKLEPLTDPSGSLENYFWDKLLGGQEPDQKVKPKSTPFRIGGAIAYADSKADATALVGDGVNVQNIHATDHVVVAARTQAADIQIAAESAAVSQSRERAAANTARNTFSVGVAIGSYDHSALAKVGGGSTITAPRIAVSGDVIIPVRESLITGGSFDRWDGLGTLKDWFNSLTSVFDIFNGVSAAKSTSDNSNGAISLSGSASILSFDNTARAVLDTSAKLNLTGNATGAWTHEFEVVAADPGANPAVDQVLHEWSFAAPAHVRASREATLLFHGGHFLPANSGGGASGGKGLGLSYTQENLTGTSEAIVREGAAIQGVDEVLASTDADGLRSWTQTPRATAEAQITAEGKDLLISIAASGGYGSSFGLNGSASVVVVNNNTRALVDDEATIKAEKFSVLGQDNPVAWSLAGGFNLSSSSGVGIGISYNGVTGATHAEIANNDTYQGERGSARASEAAAAGSVAARDLTVEARTGGRAEAIAVTGAVSWSSPDNNTSSGGFFSSIQSKYQAIQDKLAHLVDLKPTSTSKSSSSSQGGTSAKQSSSFGLSGAGSATVNDTDLTTIALVDGAAMDQDVGTAPAALVVRAVNDTDIVTASGAVALTRANNSSQTGSAAITGSVAVNLIDSITQAQLRNSTVTNSNDVTVQALAGGEQLSIAVGAAIDASNQQSKNNSFSITGSLSLSLVDNEATAKIDNTDITGEAGASGRDVNVTGYNRTFIGTGGGTLSLGGKTGAGGSVTYSDITNDVTASITGTSAVTQVDTVGVKAYNATEIGAGAAHGQASNATNGNAIGGAVVITEITNNTTASIAGASSVTATGLVEVLAKDQGADNALELIIDPANQRASVVKGLDYCGRDAGGVGATPGGNCITSVAGVVQIGRGNNIGLSFNWSDIHNNLTAKVENASVDSTGSSEIAVKAESNATTTSFAVGVGASDKVSGAGSVAVNRIDNNVLAGATGGSTLTANTITIGAKDTSRIDTLGGQINIGKNAAVGAAVTYSEIGNEARAVADQAAINARNSATLSAENDSRIRSLAVAGTFAGSGTAVSASISVNFIDNKTEATADNSTFDDPAGGANTNSVALRSEDKSEIQSLAGSVAVGSTAGAGGAFAYNKIGNTVLSSVENSTVHRAGFLDVTAKETAQITSLSVAASGGQSLAISGSISLNHMEAIGGGDGNVTTAEIKGSTVDGAATDASVKAEDMSTIKSLAGAVAIALGGPAFGGAVADNATRNSATASVSGSSLQGFSLLEVEGKNTSTIESLSAAGSGAATGAFAGSASSNRTNNRTTGEITDSEMTGSSADVRVNATDTATIKSLAGAIAAAGSAAVGAAIAVNRIANQTDARVTGKKLGTSGLDVRDLVLKADSFETIDTIAVSGGVSGDVGIAGSFAINMIDSSTHAYVSGGAQIESDRNVGVIAESDDRMTTSAGALGVGISALGLGASVVMNQIGGTTKAYIDGATTQVAARGMAGTPNLTVASGELTGAVNLAAGLDNPAARPDLAGMRATESATGVVVNASATHNIQNGVVNAGVGLVGISGVANVSIIGGETLAYINQASINQGSNAGATAAQDVHVKTSDHAYGTSFVGGVAAGAVGVGVTADVTVFDRDTRAYVQGPASLTALDNATVAATSSQGMSTLVVGASGGIVGVAGAGSVAKFTSETEAYVAGTTVNVGSLDVKAKHDTRMFLSGGAVSVGAVGVGATFDVGLDNSITKAHVDNSTVATSGQVNVDARSAAEIREWTVAGAAAGTVAAAGTASVALIGNTTQAWVSGSSIGSSGARATGLAITATDSVVVAQNAGSLGIGGIGGAGIAAAVTKVQNTTSAYMNNASAYVANDVLVDAQATRDMGTLVATAGGGLAAGIGGSVGVTLVGTALDSTQSGDANANRELNSGGSGTLSEINSFTSTSPLSSSNTTSPSDNGYANAGLTSSEINAINGKATLDTNAQIYNAAAQSAVAESFNPATQLTGKTAAIIGGSSIADANRDVRVHASEKDKISVLTGAVAGGLAGIGGAVSVVQITNNVEAAILGTTQTIADSNADGSGKVEVIAEAGKLNAGDRALTSKAFQAAGGAVALGAAIAVGDITNNVKATIGRGTQTTVEAGSGNIDVRASDTTDVDTEALGASIGLVAAGAVIDRASKSGSVVARLGNTSAPAAGSADTFVDLAGGTLNVQAERSGPVISKATAGAGGIVSGSGADAQATDTGTVQALVGNLVDVDSTGGAVSISAAATPQTQATSIGVNVGIYSAGASLATATSGANVNATLGAGSDVTVASLGVTASRNVPGGSWTAAADATAATGGLFIGIGATTATSSSGGQVTSVIGDNTTLTLTGAANISAVNNSAQFADVSGVTVGGLLAVGANIANATSGASTTADVGDMVKASGTSFTVNATGTDTNIAKAEAGSGGIIAGSAAAANTGSTSNTAASTGSGDVTRQIGVASFTVSARHTTVFNGEVDSVSASLAGASGAYATHSVNSTVAANVGDGGRVAAQSIVVKAENISTKDWLGGAVNGDAAPWNIQSGSGGVIDAPAGRSETHITHNTTAGIGANADIHVLMPVVGDGIFNMDAYNEITGRDKAKLDSGGAIAIAKASSLVTVDQANATASFGAGSEVISDLGSINAGARAQVNLDTRSSADTYGLAGAPEGNSYSIYNGLNQVLVGSGAHLLADQGAVFLAGGQSSGGVPTSINAVSTVNLWNKTAIPISTDPDARTTIANNAAVRLLGTSNVEAAGDISLLADKGNVTATATGIGKDIYRETLAAAASAVSNLFGGGDVSFDVHGGTTSVGGLAELQVDGTALTGIHRTESLTLDYQLLTTPTCSTPPCVENGRVVWSLVPTATDGVSFTVNPAVGLAANIQARITKLRSLMAQYVGDPVAVGAYQSEINFLMFKLVELGLASGTGPGGTVLIDSATGQPIINPGQWNNPSPRVAAERQILQYQAQVSGTTSAVNTAATTVRDTASNAYTAAGTIVTNAGTIDTNYGTVATNNTSIHTGLQGLAGFSVTNTLYQQTYTNPDSLVAANATRRTEINTRAAANNTDRATVDTKRAEINTRLGEIAATTNQSVIDTKQAEIATRVTEIETLLNTISTRNAEIKSRADQIVTANSQIDANQLTLANAFKAGDGSEAGEVTSINNLRTNNNTPRNSISSAAGTITTQTDLFTGGSGYATVVAAQDTAITNALSDKSTAQTQITTLTAALPTLSTVAANGPIADFVIVDDITVRLGNIRTKADLLTGTGVLSAPGDAQITITNNTPNFLKVNNLTVLSDEGGTIRYNGVLVNNNADINRLNVTGTGAALATVLTRDSQGPSVARPAITINSNYDPNGAAFANLPAPAPDIELNGNITNLRGSVTVRSKAGSIYSNGTISAGTVDVKADNGDFVQSFVDNFFHVGGDPASIQDLGTSLGAGIVANGSVFISARYLNINSLVQSGIEQWNLTLPSNPVLTGPANFYGLSQATLDADKASYLNAVAVNPGGANPLFTHTTSAGLSATYDAAQDRIEVDIAFANQDKNTGNWNERTSGRNGLYQLASDYGNIGASYDPVNARFVLDGTQVRGGYIQLYGQIMNTSQAGGAGKLRVLDGYGQIGVSNPTGLPVVINNLDAGSDPTGTGRGVAGKIDIMDVQSINTLNNTSSVVHTVVTRDYNPATGAANVKLLKETGTLNSDGSFTVTGTPFNNVNDPGATDSRHTSYTPQSDLRYVWTTGTDNSTITYWEFSGAQFFGSSDLRTAPTGTVVSKSGPHVLNSYRLDSGTYLSKGATLGGAHASGHFQSTSATRTSGFSQWIKTDEWSNCNWWTLCIAGDYHMTFTETTPTKTITTKSVKADYPIAIEFSGFNQGTVNVNSSSDVLLNGAIRNRAGTTGITSGAGIVQMSDAALISSKDLALTAATSVGAPLGAGPANAIQVDVNGGVLNASAANGNVRVNQTIGDLKVGTITAAGNALSGNGRVILTSDGSITANNALSLIQGERVELTSENGAIGSIASPLAVNVGYTSNVAQRGAYGLEAGARGDIGIATQSWGSNAGGDLLVDTVVSTGGDVKLAAAGRIIDNNPSEQIDTRTWNELLSFWDTLGLRASTAANADKQARAVQSFENGKTQNYRLYWQIRQRQADPSTYNPGFVYTVTQVERDALSASGMTPLQITQFETNRTAQYHQLHTEVGAFTPAFSAGFQYNASAAEEAQILKGSSWTERELGISVTPGLLKDITNTNPVVKSANVQGRNVTLSAGVAMGETQSAISIPTSILPENLTDAQKVALAAAERSDLDLSSPSAIVVLQRKPVNFDAVNGLSATVSPAATGHADAGKAFLASLGDGILDTIQAPGEVRIKVRGSIVNETTGTPAIQTGNLILEAANGGIGYIPDTGLGATTRPVRVNLQPDATLTARAADNVDIVAAGDMNVDTVFSRKDVKLTAANSIRDAFTEADLNVLGNNVTLTATTGSIGAAANPLDVGVNPTGLVTATAATFGQGVYLNGPLGNSFNIGPVTAGDAIHLSSDIDMKLDGPVNGPGPIQIIAGGDVAMTANAAVRATTLGLFLDAGTLTMANGASLTIDVGTIDIRTVGNAVITGIFTGNPTASAINITAGGSVLDGGDSLLDIIADTAPGAKLTITAGGQIGGNPLDVQLFSVDATSAGLIHMTDQGSLTVGTMQAGGEVLLTASGAITGNSVASSGGPVNVASSAGNVNLTSVTGQTGATVSGQAGVTLGTASSGGGSVTASSSAGNVNVGTASASTDATFSAPAGTITTGTTTATGGTVMMTANGDINATTTTAGQNVTVTSTTGAITTSNVTATGGSAALTAPGDVTVNTGTAGVGFTMDSSAGNVTATTVTADSVALLASGDVTGGTLNVGSNLNLAGTSVNATVNGGAGPVGGSVTGYNGGVATDVNLTLSGPSGFGLTNFWTSTATVNLPVGGFSVDNFVVQTSATVTNPQTILLIDQTTRAILPSDAQLYTGGAGFSLDLSGNHVLTDAQVIHQSPMHDVITPNGSNVSAVAQGYDALTLAGTQSPAPPQGDEQQRGGALVTYSGTPVATEDRSLKPDCKAQPDQPGCKQ